MHQGNWTCSGCNCAITELPFEPKNTSGLLCRDCHQKQKGSSAPRKTDGGEKPRFSGDWKCSGCGTSITSLPFEPRDTSNLLCVDCYKQKKGI